jgi:hypothetical protein
MPDQFIGIQVGSIGRQEVRFQTATQAQALNAVVFLFREVLKRDPGELSDFTRARRGRKAPTVLTQDECRRLFDELEGTYRLMAQLMYARDCG